MEDQTNQGTRCAGFKDTTGKDEMNRIDLGVKVGRCSSREQKVEREEHKNREEQIQLSFSVIRK